ncbi:MAG TPA: hypothetical protein VN259_02835 [Xanthomonadales bacterium]|nr:hypothetical protein [Xanthomonadales bacterium]
MLTADGGIRKIKRVRSHPTSGNPPYAGFPVWVARTVLQGPATEDRDSFQVQIRGDVDR